MNSLMKNLPAAILLSVLMGCSKKVAPPAGVETSTPSPSAAVSASVSSASPSKVPDFEGTFLSGESFHLADHIGRETIILNFFTTWCGPCRVDIPALGQYYAANKDKEVMVIGVDVEENPFLVKNFVANLPVTFPVLIDSEELSKALGVSTYPTTIVIGLDGTIQYKSLNPVNPETELEPLVNQNRQKPASTRLSSAEFLAASGPTLHVAPPTVQPVTGPDAATSNQIFDIQVVKDDPEQIQVEVDYAYTGDHGDKRIYVDCDPVAPNAGFGMLPIAVQLGRHKGQAPLSSYSGTPANTVSTSIKCQMSSRIDSAVLAEKEVSYQKKWKIQ